MSKKLQQSFYDAASPALDKRSNIYKPAIAFEVAANIRGIAEHYHFPNGMNAIEYEAAVVSPIQLFPFYTYDHDQQTLRQVAPIEPVVLKTLHDEWDKLVALNPRLKKIELKSPIDYLDALAGVAALFPCRDIRFFLMLRQRSGKLDAYNQADAMLEIKANKAEIEAITGQTPGWVAAPPTLRKILRKLRSVDKPLKLDKPTPPECQVVYESIVPRCISGGG